MTVSILDHFPVPVLTNKPGQIPYRRSWFLQEIRSGGGVLRMLAILSNLSPRRVAALPDRNIRTVYRALLDEMATRFPIDEMFHSQIEEEWDEDEVYYAVEKIPVEVQGVNVFEEQLAAPLVVCFALLRPFEYDNLHQDSIAIYKRWLGPMVSAFITAEAVEERDPHIRPPRGRAWRKEWAALPDLCAYSASSTGYALLDYDYQGMQENGWDSYPDLNLAEIRGLERGWKTVKPILDRIGKLVRYVDNGGTTRLQLLARAVSGEAEALREITVPKPRVTTLGEIFTGE